MTKRELRRLLKLVKDQPEQLELVRDDLIKAFGQAYKDLKPIVKPGTIERLSNVMHKLRTRALSLLQEARDA